MKIQSARIKNFRTLKDVTIPFDSVTTFIGPNGAGKSTVLRALDWFFNGNPGSLTEKDCSFGAIDEEIEVRVTFADLTENDREALGKYAPEGVSTFTAWGQCSPNGFDRISANAMGFPEFNPIKQAVNATVKKTLYKELRASHPELELPIANTGPAVDEAMTAWEAAHIDQLVDAPEALRKAISKGDFGSTRDPSLNSQSVNFMTNLDTTGGNSRREQVFQPVWGELQD